ncbi:MAG TPA: hypothetical protein VFA38_01295 [Nitrospirales bacterium]|nr:hypothetical protein [Nitrospirales bacterium]
MSVWILTAIVVLLGTVPAAAGDSVLFDTWFESYFNPSGADPFIEAHRPRYTDEYFACSAEAQKIIKEEARLHDKQCDFAADSGVRTRCRRDNQLRGMDEHVLELDRAIQGRMKWLDTKAGRSAAETARARAEFERTCAPAACGIATRKKQELIREIQPMLQCPPVKNRPLEVDPSFKNFQLPDPF